MKKTQFSFFSFYCIFCFLTYVFTSGTDKKTSFETSQETFRVSSPKLRMKGAKSRWLLWQLPMLYDNILECKLSWA